ncbi:MAG: lanthionine synthetase LanC family protein [Cyclobacteriaceae bacterium]
MNRHQFVALLLIGFGFACTPKEEKVVSSELKNSLKIANWLELSLMVDSLSYEIWPDKIGDSTVTLSYSGGVAGKVAFYLELYNQTGYQEHLNEALRGADYILGHLPDQSDSLKNKLWAFSAYGSVCGAGYILTEVYKQTSDQKYKAGALEIFDIVQSHAIESIDSVSWDSFNDVLGGLSGTGLYLLYTAKNHDLADARALAIKAGKTLLSRAIETDSTLNWTLSYDRQFILPNFSHGASGMGFFLARLFEDTQDSTFYKASLKVNTYLESIAKIDNGVFMLPYGVPNDDWERPFDVSWAHGVSGTVRFYQQLYKITGDENWSERVDQCYAGMIAGMHIDVDTTVYGSKPFPLDYRFGLVGAANFSMYHYQVTKNQEALEMAEKLNQRMLVGAQNDSTSLYWISHNYGFMSVEDDPIYTGIFYGAAGYGLSLLKLNAIKSGVEYNARFVDDPYLN